MTLVYIVDDDDAVRDSLAILLESAGLTIEAFPSADPALARAREKTSRMHVARAEPVLEAMAATAATTVEDGPATVRRLAVQPSSAREAATHQAALEGAAVV